MSSIWKTSLRTKKAAPDSLCTLALAVPQVKLHPDPAEMNFRNRVRAAIVKTIDYMLTKPGAALDVWGSIDAGTCVQSSSLASDAQLATPTKDKFPTTFGKFSDQKRSYYLQQLPDGPSSEVIEKINDKDALALGDLFALTYGVKKGDKVPPEMVEDSVGVMAMGFRHEEIGSRVRMWYPCAIDTEGNVDWAKIQLYAFAWSADGCLSTATHVSGDPACPPTNVRIDETFVLQSPCNDWTARFEKGSISLAVCDWFGTSAGPNAIALDKHGKSLTLLCEKAQSLIEVRRKALAEVTATSDAQLQLTVRLRRVREEALAVAREKWKTAPKAARTMTMQDLAAQALKSQQQSIEPKPAVTTIVATEGAA